VGVAFLSTMLAGSLHVWTGNLMILTYCLGTTALGAGYCGNAGVRFPGLGESPPTEPSFPIMAPAPGTDPRSETRRALDLYQAGELGEEALEVSDVQAQSSISADSGS
jgi:hypothetical protein